MDINGRPKHAQLLRAARDQRGWTQEEAAEALGVERSTYSNAERGHQGNGIFESPRLPVVFSKQEAKLIKDAWDGRTQAGNPKLAAELSKHGLFLPTELLQGLIDARVTRFHPSRAYYALLRDGRESISSYVSQAKESVEIVSINLATGSELERVSDVFLEMITRRSAPVKVTVSLLDPEETHLMQAIAPVLDQRPQTLAARIRDTLDGFKEFSDDRLTRRQRNFFSVRAHQALPNASAIILDGDDNANGTVQLETKGYKMGMQKSFGFEVAAPSEFFNDLRDSYRHLINDGRSIIGPE